MANAEELLRVENLARMFWEIYYDEMLNRFGSDAGRGNGLTSCNGMHRFYKAFKDMAAYSIEYSIDPYDYITASLNLLNREYRYITPRDLANGDALKRYLDNLKEMGPSMLSEWNAQTAALIEKSCRLIPATYKDEEDILLNGQLAFTSVFRTMASKTESDKLLSIYGKDAWSELHKDVKLLEFIRAEYPDRLASLERRFGKLGIHGTGV